MKWQPIETAPKDGRNMLLFGRWWSDEQGRMKEPLIGQWNTARDRWEFANAEGWWGIRPECWMPLPDTPSNAELRGARDCGEAGHDEGRCGNASCLGPNAQVQAGPAGFVAGIAPATES